MERLFLPDGADATRDALPAGLVAEEPRDPEGEVDEIGGLVEDEDDARTRRYPPARAASKVRRTSSSSGVMNPPAAPPRSTAFTPAGAEPPGDAMTSRSITPCSTS